MLDLGYALSSEEHAPNELVEHARLAEEAGFSFALISDDFHPWVDRQGHSPFVWSVIGGVALQTKALRLEGFDHVYVHQIGPHQKGFIGFYEREVTPQVGAVVGTRA